MIQSRFRARVAIGSSVVALAIGSAFAASTAFATAPPPNEPTGSGATETMPAESGPTAGTATLDADREAIVDGVVNSGEVYGLPYNRECVSELVAQLSDADVPSVLATVEASTSMSSVPDVSTPNMTMSDMSTPETLTPEMSTPAMSMPDVSMPQDSTIELPELSAEAEELGNELITCLEGDADPDLVEQVVTIVGADEETADLDPECVAAVLSTLPDETLQAMIDDAGPASASPTAVPDDSLAETSAATAATDGSSADESAAMDGAMPPAMLIMACQPETAPATVAPADSTADITATTLAG